MSEKGNEKVERNDRGDDKKKVSWMESVGESEVGQDINKSREREMDLKERLF